MAIIVYRQDEDIPIISNQASSVTGNWNSGAATSGSAGADVVSFSIGELNKVHFLDIVIGGLTNGATITIRMYHDVNGTEQEFYNQTFVVGTDMDSIPVIDGLLGENSNLRIELLSDQAADDGGTVQYEVK